MNGNSFDIEFDGDEITIDHHVRNERPSIVADADEWVVRIGPHGGELEERARVPTRGAAWECVLQYIDHGEVMTGE
jgi:hypothetical protein